MKGFKKGCQHFAGGGAAKGVPSMKRKGHPVAAKKAMVAPPTIKPIGATGVTPPVSALKTLTSGAMGRGAGQVAAPQGAAVVSVAPKKMVAARPAGLKCGGKVKKYDVGGPVMAGPPSGQMPPVPQGGPPQGRPPMPQELPPGPPGGLPPQALAQIPPPGTGMQPPRPMGGPPGGGTRGGLGGRRGGMPAFNGNPMFGRR